VNASGNLSFSQNRIIAFTEYYDDYDNGVQKSKAHKNTDIAFSPAVVGAAAINLVPVRGVEISLISKYVGRQYLDNTSNNQRSLNAFFVQHARASYTLRNILFKEMAFIAQVNNVFNKKYEPNGYTYSYETGGSLVTANYYFPMAGTNFMFGLNVKL